MSPAREISSALRDPPELILLGTGTAISTPRRGPTAMLVVDGRDVTLIDPGPGAVQRAAVAGYPVPSITRVLLTHHHPDHSLDLMALLFARKNPLMAGCAPLHVLGGPGTEDLVLRFRHVYGGWVTLPAEELFVEDLSPGPLRLRRAGDEASTTPTVSAHEVIHTPASLAYRFGFSNGASLAISGDTDVCDGAVEVARDADHYVLEAALPEESKSPGHLTPSEAVEIGARSRCRHLILTHFYPPVDLDRARAVAAAGFHGRVTFAEDGMRVPLVPQLGAAAAVGARSEGAR